MVRQAAADLAAEICLSLLLYKQHGERTPHEAQNDIVESSIAIRNEELSQLRSKAVDFLEHVASEFDAATGVLYEHAKSTAAAAVSGSGGAAGTATGIPPIESDDREILDAANAAINAVRGRQTSQELEEEEEELDVDDGAGEINNTSSAETRAVAMDVEESLAGLATHDATFQAAVAQVAFSVEWIVQLLASNLNAAAPWISRVLPSLLRLQELVPSELQFVALVARKALIAAKYQPFLPSETPAVLHALRSASSVELWPERAAALLFAQYFWFRHALLLGRQGTMDIIDMVLQRLEDDKLEVRELAANSLSGLVRGLPEGNAAELRKKFLSKAHEIFPVRGRRRRTREEREGGGHKIATTTSTTTTTASSSVPVRHGTALALQALVVSSPYDVPFWLPDVLMALVRLAPEPAPIKTTVTKALGEFRRTHEEGGLVEMKEVLSAEQWEAIRDVASPASYFV
jgi:proteasome activator subunit 4